MFGLDLQQFIENNITFTNEGGCRPNQDIYYSIEDNKFWIHVYCGNETLSPKEQRENILLWHIRNTDEMDRLCFSCDGCDGKYEDDCPQWQECQAESLYEDIRDHMYDDLFGGNGIYKQIEDHVDADVNELAEVDLLITYQYGNFADYLDKAYNSTLETDLMDEIIDNIIDNGFNMPIDNSYLNSHIEHINLTYDDYRDPINDKTDETLIKVCELLREYKIKEALKILK